MLGEHDALRDACRAGGVYEHFHLVRVALQVVVFRTADSLAAIDELLVGDDAVAFILFEIKADEELDVRKVFDILVDK